MLFRASARRMATRCLYTAGRTNSRHCSCPPPCQRTGVERTPRRVPYCRCCTPLPSVRRVDVVRWSAPVFSYISALLDWLEYDVTARTIANIPQRHPHLEHAACCTLAARTRRRRAQKPSPRSADRPRRPPHKPKSYSSRCPPLCVAPPPSYVASFASARTVSRQSVAVNARRSRMPAPPTNCCSRPLGCAVWRRLWARCVQD